MTEATAFCPYVGLQPYTEADRDYFFGRERDIRVISSNLYASPLTVLYGASGVGKSSVLLAGVVPHLRAASRTAVVVFREWQEAEFLPALKRECVQAIGAARQEAIAVDIRLPLDEFLHAAGQAFGGTLLLIFDQFEEYFLYHPETEAGNAFDSEFARAVNRDEVDVSFLLALREDGLAKLDRFRARIPNLLSNTLRLQHMDVAAAEEAIRRPLDVYNDRVSPTMPITIEDALVHTILAQVRTGQVMLGQSSGAGQARNRDETARIEAPFLQLVMTRLWKEEMQHGASVLRLQTLERLGGAEKIVRTHLDGVMQQLDDVAQGVCARFFDRLVTPSGTKLACRIDDLTNWAGDLAVQVPTVLKTLADGRILRSIAASTGKPDEVSYEIFHDVLAPGILDWRARYIEKQRRIAIEKEAEVEAAEREKERIRQRELEQARTLAEEQTRRAEAERQRAEEQQRRVEEKARDAKRLRRLLAGLIVVLIVAVTAALFAWVRHQQAVAARRDAEHQRQSAEDALESAKQALEAYQAMKHEESEKAAGLWTQAQTSYATAQRALSAKQQQSLPQPPMPAGAIIYIHIQKEQQRGPAQRAERSLERNDLNVVGIERLDIGPTSATEVRFFRQAEEREAEKIAALLRDAQTRNVQVKYVSGYERSPKIKPRQYEIWFAPDAFAQE